MSGETPIHAEDGSPLREQPKTESPFNPQNLKPQVDTSEKDGDDRPVNPRDALIESIATRADEDRAMAPGTRQEDMPYGEPVTEAEEQELEPGLAMQEQLHEPEPDPSGLPDELADDPLAEFIEMEGDEPMFRTVVNGQQKLIPLDKARAELQKRIAGDQRLQEANQIQHNLDQREQALAAREAELAARTYESQPEQPPQDAGPSEEELTQEAREVVKDLFTGSEDEAAAKLADLLLKTRGAAQVATNTVDPQEIAAQAVAAARQQVSAEARERDEQKGYKQFLQDYPDIAEDDVLFGIADRMTDDIATENPTWMPSEVMLEAGKRVREWVESQKGETTSEQPDEPNNRQERKRQLRPLPRARQGVETDAPQEEQPERPSDILADIRAARGQAV